MAAVALTLLAAVSAPYSHPVPLVTGSLSTPFTLNHKAPAPVLNLNGFAPAVTEPSWSEFKALFGKRYTLEDEAARMAAYADNVKYFEEHNAQYRAGQSTFYLGVNEFSDLTHSEFKSKYVGSKVPARTTNNIVYLPEGQAPASVDWRTKGSVTPVKNQGQCGSCWSFSTTGSTEGAVHIATGKLISLSEQQLMDCSVAEGDHSCEGGLMDYGFKYIMDNKGLDTEADYPYLMKDEPCNAAKQARHAITIGGFADVPPNAEAQLEAAVAMAPVSVAIEADQRSFQSYQGGVLTAACGTQLDHGVLAVGYGTLGAQQYWIVKNSWGPTWGQEGYILLGKGNTSAAGECGINMAASYPKSGAIAPPSPPTPPPPPAPPGPSPSGDDYGAPPCAAGETEVQITGLTGSYCAPSCSATTPCPAAGAGVTATPECVVEPAGSSTPSLCALICTPATGFLGDGGCPTGATCEAIQGTGICMFGGPTPPPPPPSPPGPSGGEYGAPPCPSDEKAITINGLNGTYCAPACSATQPCPAAPAGCGAVGECVVEQAGGSTPSLCALICKPDTKGECPQGATCEPIQGTGLCMFPNGPTPPPPPSPPSPPGPAGGEYGDPPCPADELAITINGLPGTYCAPSCSATEPCPAAPAGCGAVGECVVDQAGGSTPTLCALICKPDTKGECPSGATCQPIQGTGVCTYASVMGATYDAMMISFGKMDMITFA